MIKLNIQRFSDGKVVIDTQLNTKDFDNGLDRIEKSTQKSGMTVKNIVAGLGITALIKKGMQVIGSSIDDAVKRSDTLNNFPKVMSNLGISAKEADTEIKRMSEALAGLPTTLDQGALAVQRFASKNGNVKKSTDIFLALNNAILAGGASAEIQSSALEQLSQSYAKGKPDMMEWRTAMTAMPAQLKQVAQAMGYIDADALGEALRDGTVSMDDFMDTVVKLNKEGVKGFQSFEKQARNSTGGIGTAVTVAKTQVVKGVTDMIEGLNKGLKKAKLGSISEIIANLGKSAKKGLDKVAEALSKVDFRAIINTIKKLIPIVASLTAGFIAYRTALVGIKAINIATSIGKTAIAFVQLIPAITSAKDAMILLGMVFKAHPIGLVVAGVTALATAFILLSNKQSKVQKNLKKTDEVLKNYNNTMKEVRKQKDESLSKSMNEIYYYKSLSEELKNITDENGRVKEGYQDRASFIVGELSKATGIEIQMNDGVIESYQQIQEEIDKTLEKKKAEAYFNAHQEEYNEALKKEAELQKKVARNTSDRDTALKNITNLLNEEAKANSVVRAGKKELLQLAKGEIDADKLSTKGKRAFMSLSMDTINMLKEEKEAYIEYNKKLKEANKTYADNEYTIEKWRKAEEALANENYDAVSRIFNDTITFNAKTEKANNEAFEKGKASRQAYIEFLKQHQDKYSEEFINKEQERINKEIDQLENEKNQANEKLKQKNADAVATLETGINDQLSAIEGHRYEFRKTADGNMEFYVDGIRKSGPVSATEASFVTSQVLNKLEEGSIGSEDVGKNIILGLRNGMSSVAQSAISVAGSIADLVVNTIKNVAGVHSPSRRTIEIGKYLDEGLSIGIQKGERDTLKVVGDYADNVVKEFDNINIDNTISDMYKNMQSAVNLEMSKMQSSVEGGGIFNTIANSTPVEITLNAPIEMDGQKVGRVVAPSVSRTIKTGGGY